MRRVTLASVRLYARRYVAAAVAVTLAVAFIVLTDGITSAAKAGMFARLGASFHGADLVVVGASDVAGADGVLQAVRARGGRAAVNAYSILPVSAGGTSWPGQTEIGTVSGSEPLRWQQLTAGAFPSRPGEIVLDEHAARVHAVTVGDTVVLGRSSGSVDAVVSGLVRSSSGPHAAAAYASWPELSRWSDFVIVTDVVAAGVSAAGLTTGLPGHVVVEPVGAHLSVLQAKATKDVDVAGAVLLVFASIALFVAVLVIANTFAVMVAQRQRDLALLRCIGATRRQLLRGLRLEALLLGAGSATLGLVVGGVLAVGLAALAGAVLTSLPVGEVRLSPVWAAAAWLVGVLATLVAATLPARRGSRVGPLAALRPEPGLEVGSRAGLARLSLAVLCLGAGCALLLLSVRQHALLPMIGGGAVSFVGVLLLCPLLVPLAVRAVGLVVGRLGGTTGRLAVANAVRNPRRTSATAASLLVGVTLVTGMVVGMATVRSSADRAMDQQLPLDASLTATGPALPAGLAARVRDVDGVQQVSVLPGISASVTGRRLDLGRMTLVAAGPNASSALHGSPDFSTPEHGVLYVAWQTVAETGLRPGGTVTARVGERSTRLRVQPSDGFGSAAVVSAADLRMLTDTPEPSVLWVKVAGRADAAEVSGALSALAGTAAAQVDGGLGQRATIDHELDVALAAVLALLAVGVVIALVGVGSTLGLSVAERTREHALLRALGLTRRRLRATLSVEAAMLAGVAGLLGAVLGTLYAWVGVEAVVGDVIADVELVVPWAQVGLVALMTALAGLAAGVLPARRAARVSPAAGLAAD